LAKGKSSNPTSFTVYTKSGLRYDYVTVSKALGKTETDLTLFWLVSKVSDTKGNYFTVTYGGDASTNDFYPSRIDYTGNATAGLSPYASIRLSYMSNPYFTGYLCQWRESYKKQASFFYSTVHGEPSGAQLPV
jgi:RHS repeat-associated core domain protein